MRWLLCLVLLLAVVAAPPAQAQITSREGIDLQNQILELRHQLQELRAGGGGSASALGNPQPAPVVNGSGGDLVAQLLDRVSRLEDEVRQLRGRIDEINNSRQQAEADLKKQIEDLKFQLSQGGAGAAGAAAAAATATPPPRPAAVVPAHPTPEVALARGDAALARRDYATAEAMAREVIATAPHSPRVSDAQFLLAEALSGKHDNRGAALAFDDAYRKAPKGARAPDSLLGLANALTAIGQKKAACETLNELHAKFPVLRPDLRAPSVRAARAAGCG